MGCLRGASFAVIINGAPSRFFKASLGLRQGCLLSPFLFLIVTETLSRLLKEAITEGCLRGLKVTSSQTVSHLLFVDDVWVSIFGSLRDVSSLSKELDLFCKATCMKINLDNSCLLTSFFSKAGVTSFLCILPVQNKYLDKGVKYLGFNLKPKKYKKYDWVWLVRKVESRIDSWVHKTLSWGGRLVLLTSVLEGIPVY